MNEQIENSFEQALGNLLELPKAEREASLEQIGRTNPHLRARLASVLALGESRSGELLTPPESGLAPPVTDLENDPLIGASFDGYTLIALVGAGGSGRVYEARQSSPSRRVALKVLQGSLVSTAQVKRFREEAQVLAGLQHSGICGLIASGNALIHGQSLPYLVMEFVEGTPLTQAVMGLSLVDKLSLMIKVCEAVEYAHRKGIIHRDLKPANVLVELPAESPPRPRVVDFGLAKLIADDQRTLTRDASTIIGTIHYMSPERLVINGSHAVPDTRWDVYALGVMLFEILAARRPFDGDSDSASVAAILRANESPLLSSVLPNIHSDINLIVANAMARDINQRYASVASLADDLRAHLALRPISAHPPSLTYRLTKFVRRERGLSFGVGMALLAIIAGTIGTVTGLRRAMHSRNEARAALDVSRINEYIAKIQSASAHFRNSDAWQARQSLEAAPEDFRGLEWRLLRADCEQSVDMLSLPVPRPEDSCPSMDYSTDGSSIAYADGDALVITNLTTGAKRTAKFEIGPEKRLENVQWSKKCGIYLCVAGEPASLIVVDPEILAIQKQITIDSRLSHFDICLDANENHVVISGSRFAGPRPRGYIQVRDALTLDSLYEDNARPSSMRAIPTSLPNTLITLSDDDNIELLNWSTGETTRLPIPTDGGGQGRNDLAVSGDDSRFAVGSMFGTQVWSVSPLRQIIGFGATPGVSWHHLTFGPTGETLFSIQNASMIGWDINTGATTARAMMDSADYCRALTIAPDGRELLSVFDNTIRVLKTDVAGQETMIRAREGSALSPDFTTLAKLSLPPDDSGMVTVSLVDPITGTTLSTPELVPVGFIARRTAWSPNSVLLAIEYVSQDGKNTGLSVFNTKIKTRQDFAGNERQFSEAVFSADSSRIACITALNRWMIADANSLEVQIEESEASDTRVNSISFSPDGTYVALGLCLSFNPTPSAAQPTSSPGVVSLRRCSDGKEIRSVCFEGKNADLVHVYFAPNGRWIAAFRDNEVLLIDASTFNVASKISLIAGTQGLAWCPDSTRLLAGCVDSTVRILAVFDQRTTDGTTRSSHLMETLSLRGDSWMKRPFASADGTRVGCVTVFPANRCFVWDSRPTQHALHNKQ